jgi:hypothetical protein
MQELVGNPAVLIRSVAFRPCLTAGLALSLFNDYSVRMAGHYSKNSDERPVYGNDNLTLWFKRIIERVFIGLASMPYSISGALFQKGSEGAFDTCNF